jgi:uncharacterized RDD family membrane protein YckC
MAGYSQQPERDDTDVIGKRIVAQIIDLLLIGMLSIAGLFLFALLRIGAGGSESALAGAMTGLGLMIAGLTPFAYNFVLEAFWDGYTVGKRLLGIKVVEEDGSKLSTSSAFIRSIPGVASFGWLAYLVALLSMATSDKRQRLFDRLAGTVVVTESPVNQTQQRQNRKTSQQQVNQNTSSDKQTRNRGQAQNRQVRSEKRQEEQ